MDGGEEARNKNLPKVKRLKAEKHNFSCMDMVKKHEVNLHQL